MSDKEQYDNTETLSTVSLVCGLVSIFVLPLAFGGTAIVLGFLVLQRVDDRDSRAYSNARIGLIAGIVGIALWIITLVTMGYLGINGNSLFSGTVAPESAF